MVSYDVADAPNDAAIVEKVAREMLERYGEDALRRLKDEADQATHMGDELSARAWLDIAEAVLDLLLQRFLHPAAVTSSGEASRGSKNADRRTHRYR
jgi:hypothetical protein